jgi:hypothetical protein
MKKIKLITIISFLSILTAGFSSELSNIQNHTLQKFAKNHPPAEQTNAYIGILANSLCIKSLNKPENVDTGKLLKNLIKQCQILQDIYYNLMNKGNKPQTSSDNNTFEVQMGLVNAAENSIAILKTTQQTLLLLDKATLLVKPDKLHNIKIASYYCYALLQSAKLTAEKNIDHLTSKNAKKRLNDSISSIMNKSLTLHYSIIDEVQMQKVLDDNS